MVAYNAELAKAGIFKEGDGLKPSAVGTRVRLRGKTFTVLDGPFAETKELVAGYSVIEVGSKQEAIDVLGRWPIEDGDVELELRLLYGPEDFPADPTAGERREAQQCGGGVAHTDRRPANRLLRGEVGRRARLEGTSMSATFVVDRWELLDQV